MFLGALTSGTARMWRLNILMNPGSSEAKAFKVELSNRKLLNIWWKYKYIFWLKMFINCCYI